MKNLDLHGVKHEDVKNEVIRFIEANWNSDDTRLEIVTGYSAPMKKVVREVLEEYHLDYQVGDDLNINRGFIRVTMP